MVSMLLSGFVILKTPLRAEIVTGMVMFWHCAAHDIAAMAARAVNASGDNIVLVARDRKSEAVKVESWRVIQGRSSSARALYTWLHPRLVTNLPLCKVTQTTFGFILRCVSS
jgi:hypothetical protein